MITGLTGLGQAPARASAWGGGEESGLSCGLELFVGWKAKSI